MSSGQNSVGTCLQNSKVSNQSGKDITYLFNITNNSCSLSALGQSLDQELLRCSLGLQLNTYADDLNNWIEDLTWTYMGHLDQQAKSSMSSTVRCRVLE